LHPLTHEVYTINEEVVLHDFFNYVDIDFGDFEKLTTTGPCSAERIVEYAKQKHGNFNFSQLVFIQMKGHSDEKPRFAWASRIRVKVDTTLHYLTPGGCFGAEFLWIWPPSAAINAFLGYKERNRLNIAGTATLEQFAPSVSHLSAAPGAQIGPDDFDGAVRVPLSKLSADKRFFISCIRPQRTQFQRRRVTDKWTEVMRDAENAAKLKFWASSIEIKSVVKAKVVSDAVLWAAGIGPEKKRKGTMSAVARARPRVAFSGLAIGWLPDDLLTRIVGFVLTGAMAEHRTVAATTICTLRCVSRDFRAMTDGFMGLTLGKLTRKMMSHVVTGDAGPARSLSAQIRAVGITPRQALELQSFDLVVLPNEAVRMYPELRHYATVPRWQRYLHKRRDIDMSVAAEDGCVGTKEEPSKAFKRLCVHGHSRGPNFEHVATNPEYDCLITKGNAASDHANEVMELAGV
jgi:hypothetical protein